MEKVSTTLLFFSRVVPPYTFGRKATNVIPDDHYFFQVLNFPHYFYVYIIYPLNAMSNS